MVDFETLLADEVQELLGANRHKIVSVTDDEVVILVNHPKHTKIKIGHVAGGVGFVSVFKPKGRI